MDIALRIEFWYKCGMRADFVNSSRMAAVSYAFLALALRAYGGGISTGLIPLTELPPGSYQGFEGGLYPGGSNAVPAAHLAAGLGMAAQVQPRDAAGQPAPNGFIVMISVGMSNTTHEFAPFERQEDLNTHRNARLLIINAAQGGQTASEIKSPTSGYWNLVDERLAATNVTQQQVQVAWVKEANAGPPNNFPIHAQELAADLRGVVQTMRDRFPNLRLCYLSSRIYGGYSVGGLNPEPQAYENGFSVKWLIEDQIHGDADLNFDPANGPVEAPWLAWGPYLWADGLTPRASDGLIWAQSDMESDNVHPSPSGEQKVADLVSGFFGTETTALGWYSAQPGVSLRSVDAMADAHVALPQPTQNFGTSATLQIASGASDSDVLLKFDLTGVTEPILFAKLSFRITTAGGAPRATVRATIDDSWSETGVTWNNAPAGIEPPIITTGSISRDGSLSADVTQAVLNDPNGVVSLRLSAPSAGGLYHSRESGQPPRLILVVATPPAGPEIPTTSAWGLAGMMVVMITLGAVIVNRTGRRATAQ